MSSWALGPENGTLTVHTDVAGRAARLGHRLTIVMGSWRAAVEWVGEKPASATVSVDVDSLSVVAGEGGMTPLSAPEKALARTNALKAFDAKRYPTIEFCAEEIQKTADGYQLSGPLTIHGVTRTVAIDLTVRQDGDGAVLNFDTEVSQRAHKITPYSMAMGSMKVADTVRICFEARSPQS